MRRRRAEDRAIKLLSDDSLELFNETMQCPTPSSRSAGYPKPLRDKSVDATIDHFHDQGSGEVTSAGRS